MFEVISVGLGEYAISDDPDTVLVAFGLGSCLGIGFYDTRLKLAGLLHAILPHRNGNGGESPWKYVDSGMAALYNEMILRGASHHTLLVRMAGGARTLPYTGQGGLSSVTDILSIGARNIEAAIATLRDLKLTPASQEVGDNISRTVRFYVMDGTMRIRATNNSERFV